MQGAFGGAAVGYKTAAANTVIQRLVQPRKGAFARVSTLKATGANAGHQVIAYRPLGRTTFTAAGAAGQAVVAIKAQPYSRILAANDYMVVREQDGVARLYQVQSVAGLNVTLAANLTAGVTAGGDLWLMGKSANTDLDPRTGEVHPPYQLPAAGQATFSDSDSGVAATLNVDEPLLLQHTNQTAAGSIDMVSWSYTRE